MKPKSPPNKRNPKPKEVTGIQKVSVFAGHEDLVDKVDLNDPATKKRCNKLIGKN